jgi:hypothetical protein
LIPAGRKSCAWIGIPSVEGKITFSGTTSEASGNSAGTVPGAKLALSRAVARTNHRRRMFLRAGLHENDGVVVETTAGDHSRPSPEVTAVGWRVPAARQHHTPDVPPLDVVLVRGVVDRVRSGERVTCSTSNAPGFKSVGVPPEAGTA